MTELRVVRSMAVDGKSRGTTELAALLRATAEHLTALGWTQPYAALAFVSVFAAAPDVAATELLAPDWLGAWKAAAPDTAHLYAPAHCLVGVNEAEGRRLTIDALASRDPARRSFPPPALASDGTSDAALVVLSSHATRVGGCIYVSAQSGVELLGGATAATATALTAATAPPASGEAKTIAATSNPTAAVTTATSAATTATTAGAAAPSSAAAPAVPPRVRARLPTAFIDFGGATSIVPTRDRLSLAPVKDAATAATAVPSAATLALSALMASAAAKDRAVARAVAECRRALGNCARILVEFGAELPRSCQLTVYAHRSTSPAARSAIELVCAEVIVPTSATTMRVQPRLIVVDRLPSEALLQVVVVTPDSELQDALQPKLLSQDLPLKVPVASGATATGAVARGPSGASASRLRLIEDCASVDEVYCSLHAHAAFSPAAAPPAKAAAVSVTTQELDAMCQALVQSLTAQPLTARLRWDQLFALRVYYSPLLRSSSGSAASAPSAPAISLQLRERLDKLLAAASGKAVAPVYCLIAADVHRCGAALSGSGAARGFSVLSCDSVWFDSLKLATEAWIFNMKANLWFRSLGYGDRAGASEKWRNFSMHMISNDDDATTFLKLDAAPNTATAAAATAKS